MISQHIGLDLRLPSPLLPNANQTLLLFQPAFNAGLQRGNYIWSCLIPVIQFYGEPDSGDSATLLTVAAAGIINEDGELLAQFTQAAVNDGVTPAFGIGAGDRLTLDLTNDVANPQFDVIIGHMDFYIRKADIGAVGLP